MKTLIIKNGNIKSSETFILDHAKHITGETILFHGVSPAEYGKKRSRLKDNLQLLNIKLEQEFKFRKNIAYNYFFVRLLRKLRPDIVLAEYGVTGAKIFSTCNKLRVPLIIHFHGYDAHNHSVVDAYMEDYKKMLKVCSAVIVVSKYMKDIVVELGADPDSTFINPCGVDTSRFVLSDIDKAGKYFLSVGRFVEKKAPQITLFAFAKFNLLYPGVKLIMVGEGPLLDSCKDLSVALGIKENVEFLGLQSHDSVRTYFDNAYAFIQHSITAQNGDSEGSPVSVAEASACGLPIVSTYHAGIPDLVIHGRTGYLVKEKDAESMAYFMGKLISDRDHAKYLGLEGRKHIEKYYSQEVTINRLQSILEWGLGRKSKPSLNIRD